MQDEEIIELFDDPLVAVLPHDHKLASMKSVSLSTLTGEPFILQEEGSDSIIMKEFQKHGLAPDVRYEVYDDYSILSMIRQGLGISVLYERAVAGYDDSLCTVLIKENPTRSVCLTYMNRDTLSLVSRAFIKYVVDYFGVEL